MLAHASPRSSQCLLSLRPFVFLFYYLLIHFFFSFFFFNDTATTEIYTLSLHDALPISAAASRSLEGCRSPQSPPRSPSPRSEEHTSELQSLRHLVCRLLLEKKKKNKISMNSSQ